MQHKDCALRGVLHSSAWCGCAALVCREEFVRRLCQAPERAEWTVEEAALSDIEVLNQHHVTVTKKVPLVAGNAP